MVGLPSIHVTPRVTRTRAWLRSTSPRRSSVNSPKRSAHQDASKIINWYCSGIFSIVAA
jgi:hypothetical protein